MSRVVTFPLLGPFSYNPLDTLLSQSDQFGGGFFDDKKIRVSYGGSRLDDGDTAGPRRRPLT